MVPAISRRQVLRLAAAAAAAFPLVTQESASALVGRPRDTIEAWADTIVPGERRFPGDRVVLGATPGPGAVQAGAWDLYRDPDVGLAPLLPAIAALLDTQAVAYLATHPGSHTVGVPSFVALDFEGRSAVAQRLLQGSGPDQLLWYGVAAIAMLAFHTAAHLDTATAVAQGHPGLAWLGFPEPDADGIWRFPAFSYRRVLASTHPGTTASGQPG
jgi:hypothetical protein